MWEMYTLEAPFADLTAQSILMGLMNGSLHLPIPPACEPEWRGLVEACMDANPANRPSFQELAMQLQVGEGGGRGRVRMPVWGRPGWCGAAGVMCSNVCVRVCVWRVNRLADRHELGLCRADMTTMALVGFTASVHTDEPTRITAAELDAMRDGARVCVCWRGVDGNAWPGLGHHHCRVVACTLPAASAQRITRLPCCTCWSWLWRCPGCVRGWQQCGTLHPFPPTPTLLSVVRVVRAHA